MQNINELIDEKELNIKKILRFSVLQQQKLHQL